MEDVRSVEMNDEERDEFLGSGGTGVASFPRGESESPYTVPVSYGYDTEKGDFYFRLSFGPDTEKEGVVGDRKPMSIVRYEKSDTGWQSVVASGTLKEGR